MNVLEHVADESASARDRTINASATITALSLQERWSAGEVTLLAGMVRRGPFRAQP
jgi:hypothetical protein